LGPKISNQFLVEKKLQEYPGGASMRKCKSNQNSKKNFLNCT